MAMARYTSRLLAFLCVTPLGTADVKVTLKVHTSVLPGWSSTSNNVEISYQIDGKYTLPVLLCKGGQGCQNGNTVETSGSLSDVPTKVKVQVLGNNGWLMDALSVSIDGKLCNLVAGPTCLDGDDINCGRGVVEFDIHSACPDMFPSVTLTAHTASSPDGAGTKDKVTVSYEIDGSSTSPSTLCDPGLSNCQAGKTASAVTFLRGPAMPTKVTLRKEGDDEWLFDTLSLTMDGHTCTLQSGNRMFMTNVNSFDVMSECPDFFSTTLEVHTADVPYADTLDDVTVSYEVNGDFGQSVSLCKQGVHCQVGETAKVSSPLNGPPTKVKIQVHGNDNWFVDSLALTIAGKRCSLVSGMTCFDADDVECRNGVIVFDVLSACGNVFTFGPTPRPTPSPTVSCKWRQTGGCSVYGSREPSNDMDCDDGVYSGWSGYCDCNANNRYDSPDHGFGCGHDDFKCSDICNPIAMTVAAAQPHVPAVSTDATSNSGLVLYLPFAAMLLAVIVAAAALALARSHRRSDYVALLDA